MTSFNISPIYITQELKHTIRLTANELNTTNVDRVLETYLKHAVGNKCVSPGYVDKDSIQIVSRTIGKGNSRFLDGSITFQVTYKANVCCPNEQDILNVDIVGINKMGILAKKENTPLNIVIPKNLHLDTSIYKKIDPEIQNQKIIIQVIGRRFELNSKEMFIIGQLLDVIE